MRFIWDYDNIKHIARHNVTPEELKSLFEGPTVELEYQDWHDEYRLREVGMTSTGRFLEVLTTVRRDGIRPVTAYDAPPKSIKAYLEYR